MSGYWRLTREPSRHPAHPPVPWAGGRELAPGSPAAGRPSRKVWDTRPFGLIFTIARNGRVASPHLPGLRNRGSSARVDTASVTGMTLVAGIDSSTQSTKVLLVRAED